jgi:hypothetical protein
MYVSKVRTTIYEEDIKEIGGGNPRFRYLPSSDFRGTVSRIPFAKGPRPRRKKGESPLS